MKSGRPRGIAVHGLGADALVANDPTPRAVVQHKLGAPELRLTAVTFVAGSWVVVPNGVWTWRREPWTGAYSSHAKQGFKDARLHFAPVGRRRHYHQPKGKLIGKQPNRSRKSSPRLTKVSRPKTGSPVLLWTAPAPNRPPPTSLCIAHSKAARCGCGCAMLGSRQPFPGVNRWRV